MKLYAELPYPGKKQIKRALIHLKSPLFAALTVAFLVVCSGFPAEAKSYHSVDFNSPFGINFWHDGLENTGIQWVRINIPWRAVEKTGSRFNFEEMDKHMKKYEDMGVGVLAVLSGPPDEYRRVPENYNPITTGVHKGWGDFPPKDLGAWGKYVYQTVGHFGNRIKFWEIWNEPNVELFFNGGTVDDYVALLKVAYTQAKKADPSCKIVGLGGTDPFYAKKVFQKGGFHFMDIASIHIYNVLGHPPEKGWYLKLIADTQNLIEESGGGKDIWITETGWPTHSGFSEGWIGVSLEHQAKFLVRSMVLSLSLGVKKIFWFCAANAGEDRWNFEYHQGLLYRNGEPKPSYFAYTTLSKIIGNSRFIKKVKTSVLHAYLFQNKNQGCFVLWTIAKKATLNFKGFPAEGLKALDINNKEIDVNGSVLMITDSPVYVMTEKINQFENVLYEY